MSDSSSRQVVHFHQKHYDAVVRGEKVTTVRWDEDVQVGPAVFIFEDHPTATALTGHVTAVETYPLAQLTPEAARQPKSTDMVEFAEALRANYYPTMPVDARVEVVVISLDPVGN